MAIDSFITAELALDVVAVAAGRRFARVLLADLLAFFCLEVINQVECTYSGASKERIVKCNVARFYGRRYGPSNICGNSADEDECNEAQDCELERC